MRSNRGLIRIGLVVLSANPLARISLLCAGIFSASALFGQSLAFHESVPRAFTVNVPATANPYLAGMPAGAQARVGDSAPQQSPVLIARTLSHAVAVTFSATGSVEHTPECPPTCYGPNGQGVMARHLKGAENGISDIFAPMDSLAGVFLSDEPPDHSKAPPRLEFRRREDRKSVV